MELFLYDLTKRDVYMDFNVNDIYVENGNEYIQFSNGQFIKLVNQLVMLMKIVSKDYKLEKP